MQKCPKCGSFNTRKSRHKLRKRSFSRMFSSWFRCRDCSTRFLRTDWVLARRWLLATLAAAALIVLGSWSLQRGRQAPSPTNPESNPAALPAPGSGTAGSLLLYTDTATQRAAERGEQAAQYRLGLELLQQHRERGERGLLEDAIGWIRESAGQGYVRAQLALGALYEKGRGVIQDYREAVSWYRRAAAQGEPEAMLRLGQMTEAGQGVEKDLLEAYVWLNLASARGDQRAEMSRDRVRSLLSPEQITEAQDRSRRLDRELPHPEPTGEQLPSGL